MYDVTPSVLLLQFVGLAVPEVTHRTGRGALSSVELRF